MRRALKNMLVLVAAIVMMLSMSITAFASSATPKLNVVKSIAIKEELSAKGKVSKVTLYANGAEAAVDELYFGRDSKVEGEYTKSATPTTKTYKLAITGTDKDSKKPLDVCVLNYTNSNEKAVEVVLDKENNELTVKAIGVGTAKIKVYDEGTKKSATLTVTSKGLVDSIEFNAAKEEDEFSKENYIRIEQKGKIDVAATVNADASNKKLKYVIADHEVLVEGKWQKSLDNRDKVVAVASVDSKGKVTAKAESRDNVEMSRATVYVYAQDQKETCYYKDDKGRDKTKSYTSGVYTKIPVYIYPATYAKDDIIQITNLERKNSKPGKSNTYKEQVLYTNASDANHTMQIIAAAYTGEKVDKKTTKYTKDNTKKVVYTTSNAKVATVSADGVITAVGNGSATISAVPAYGFTTPKATVKVSVKTKATDITLKSENLTVFVNKKASAGASIKDKKVSNKKLAYSVLSGNDVISVDGKGKITGLKEGFATVKVASADGFTSKNIKVEVLEPISKVAFYDEKGDVIKNATIYEYDGLAFDDAGIARPNVPTSLWLKAVGTSTRKIDKTTYATPTYPNSFDYSSSNWRVVDVYGDEAVANGKGSAKITATATDTSKKKATLSVNVIKLVDEITINNAEVCYDYECDDKLHYKMVVEAGSKTTIKASTNADASNKKLSIVANADIKDNAELNTKTWELSVSETCTLKEIPLLIEAQDKVEIGENQYTEPYAIELVVKVEPKGAMRYATADDVHISGSFEDPYGVAEIKCTDTSEHECDFIGYNVKEGSTIELGVDFNPLVKDRTVKWTTEGKGISLKNGVLTAKKESVGNKVILTYKTGEKTTATKSIIINVVKPDADYQVEMNKRVEEQLANFKGEGLKLYYDGDKEHACINVSIEDPYLAINDQKNTGIVAILKSIVDPDVCSVQISGWVPDVYYELIRNNGTIDILKYKWYEDEPCKTIATVEETDIEAIASVLKEQLELEGYKTYADMNGVEGEIVVNSLIKDASVEAENGAVKYVDELVNKANFNVYFYMTDSNYEAMIDSRIAEELAALNKSGELAKAGIESIGYDEATNTALVNIKDGTVTLETADTIRADVADALKAIFEGAESADVAVEVWPEYREKSFSRSEKELDEAINELFEEILDFAGRDTQIYNLDGALATAKVTFPCGYDGYTYDYAVKFERTAVAVDAQMDERIQAGIGNVESADSGLTAEYDAETNTVTIKVEKTDNSVIELANIGLIDAIKEALDCVATSSKDIKASVVVGDKKTDITELTASKLEEAFGLTEVTNLGELMDKNAVITVVYPQISGDVKLTYQVVYEIDIEKICGVVDEALVDAAAKATEEATIIDSITYEDHKVSVSFNGIEASVEDIKAVKDIIKAATPNDYFGISAKTATVVYTDEEKGKDYRQTLKADEVNAKNIEDFIRAAFDIANDKPVTADKIAGNSLLLKVVYGTEDSDKFFIVYTIDFMELAKDTEEENESEADALEVTEVVEETTEEAAEETTEEVVEETTEEVVEETTEEVVEETTEEVVEEAVEEVVE